MVDAITDLAGGLAVGDISSIDFSANAIVVDKTMCDNWNQNKTTDYYELMLKQKFAFNAELALFDEWSWMYIVVPWMFAANMKAYKNGMLGIYQCAIKNNAIKSVVWNSFHRDVINMDIYIGHIE